MDAPLSICPMVLSSDKSLGTLRSLGRLMFLADAVGIISTS